MDVSELLRAIRREVKRQIASKEITQAELARKMDLKPSLISAFLKDNQEGGPLKNISIVRLGKMMKVLHITVEQFLPAPRAAVPRDTRFIPVVSQRTAIRQATVPTNLVLRTLDMTYRTAEEKAGKALPSSREGDRFVAIVATRAHAKWMRPIFEEGSILIIDRHKTEVIPKPMGLPSLYAVSDGDFLEIGYLHSTGTEQLTMTFENSPIPHLLVVSPLREGRHIVGVVNTIQRHLEGTSGSRNKPA